jgi:hydroxymethylpyrimidine pyrophosphatase-like HAD family hydrolase
MNTVICDLDGTLFDIDHRLYLLEEKRFDEFWAACVDDTPNEWCVTLLRALLASGINVIFVSGRNEVARPETIRQLQLLGFGRCKLLMRPANDRQSDTTLKEKWLNNELAIEILFAIEDRARVAEMYRNRGIVVLQCATGDF